MFYFIDYLLSASAPAALSIFIAFLVLVFAWNRLRRPHGAPPGPVGLPLVGSLLSVGKQHIGFYLMDLKKRYGDIFGVYLGNAFHVVLNDYETGREAFLKFGDVFSGRQKSFILSHTYGDAKGNLHGLLLSEGRIWKEQRKFALSKLREFGMGKVSIEEKIKEEISCFLTECKSKNMECFDIQLLLSNSVSNVICSIIFGSRFDYDDTEFQKLMAAINANATNYCNVVFLLVDALPFTRFLPQIRPRYETIIQNNDNVCEFIERRVDEHLEKHDPDNTNDFIDAYLNILKEEKQNGVTNSTFTAKELTLVTLDLFTAGSETTTTTLRWGFLFLMKHPTVMKKVQAEISEVMGRSRLPNYDDRTKMPYTEATITEIQRLGNILPFGGPHTASEEVNFKGYTIPARSVVLLNLTSIFMDPVVFPNPEIFRPERHLDKNGNFVRNEAMIPFSVGRRACLGENLAKMELFLFFTSILQNFVVMLPDDATEPCMDAVVGLTAAPKPYQMKMIPW